MAPTDYLWFHQPTLGPEEEQALAEVLRSGWLTTGPRAQAFEERFAAYVGARRAVSLSSCTAALHLALRALGIGPGDEVITTPITWAATANVIVHCGATPVFADVEPDTLNLAPAAVEARLTPRTRAVILVHFAGHPGDLDAFRSLQARHGFALIEDAAHAIEAEWGGRRVGTFGAAAAYSFYATKSLTTGEGGMLVTDDGALADRVRSLSQHGLSLGTWTRYRADGVQHYALLEAGYKANMSDLQAALGLVQLGRLEAGWAARRERVGWYDALLADVGGIRPLGRRPGVRHAHHLYVILVDPGAGRDRDAVRVTLHAAGIGTGIHFPPLHLEPFYRGLLGGREGDLPVAEAAGTRVLSLPLYPGLTAEQVGRVADAVRTVVGAPPMPVTRRT
ncbi:MAG: DegT/DnrJ/EryC1/StrS family aminotransferase [Candidatus Methylomirabilales bacterium]